MRADERPSPSSVKSTSPAMAVTFRLAAFAVGESLDGMSRVKKQQRSMGRQWSTLRTTAYPCRIDRAIGTPAEWARAIVNLTDFVTGNLPVAEMNA